MPAIVYVLAIAFVGIYVASAIFIAVFMVVLGKYSAWKAALIGVLVSVAFFVMFEVWFKVPLPKGTLEPLASSATEPAAARDDHGRTQLAAAAASRSP